LPDLFNGIGQKQTLHILSFASDQPTEFAGDEATRLCARQGIEGRFWPFPLRPPHYIVVDPKPASQSAKKIRRDWEDSHE
jgi:hypothetical protein